MPSSSTLLLLSAAAVTLFAIATAEHIDMVKVFPENYFVDWLSDERLPRTLREYSVQQCAERVNAYSYLSCNRRCEGLLVVIEMLCDPRDSPDTLTRNQLRSYCCPEKAEQRVSFDESVRRMAMKDRAPLPSEVEA